LHFEGTYSIGAPKDKVFDLLTDPNQISKCMPDLQKLEVKSKDEFMVVVRAGVAFIKGDFKLNFNVAERVPPTHAKLVARGSGMGSAIDLQATMDLKDEGASGTNMKWSAEAMVGGRIASVGQRLLNSQAEKIIKQLFDCLESRFK
jgi:carbon monoxide dehydrogenase subunit G